MAWTANDLAALAKDVESVTTQINLFNETTEKIGLRMSFENKTEYLTFVKRAPNQMKLRCGQNIWLFETSNPI